MSEFTFLEIQLIRSSLNNKSDGEIAALLERSIEEVHEKINEITGGGAEARCNRIQELQQIIYRKQQEENDKKNKKEEARRKKQRELQERHKLKTEQQLKNDKERSLRLQNEAQHQKKKREWESRRTYKTRELHLDQLQSVRIDNKTIVLVKPGTDINKIKRQYYRPPVSKETLNA